MNCNSELKKYKLKGCSLYRLNLIFEGEVNRRLNGKKLCITKVIQFRSYQKYTGINNERTHVITFKKYGFSFINSE